MRALCRPPVPTVTSRCTHHSCNGKDGTVQEKLAQWMVDNCMTSNFWWALNPGSADTDGLMSPDWTHYDERSVIRHP